MAISQAKRRLLARLTSSGQGGGPYPDPGAAILSWDDAAANDNLIQWDDDTGNPQYLEWDI